MKSGNVCRVAHRRFTKDGDLALRLVELPGDADPTLAGLNSEALREAGGVCSVTAFCLSVAVVACGAFAVDHWPGDPSTAAAWSWAGLGFAIMATWMLLRRRAYLLRLSQREVDDDEKSRVDRSTWDRMYRAEQRVKELEELARSAKTEPSLLRPPGGVTAGGGTQGPDEDEEDDEDDGCATTVHSRTEGRLGPPNVHD